MRYLSFTFDDGFIKGAKLVDKLLEPYKATFYLTTGWIRPYTIPILDKFNIGADHGHIQDWVDLVNKGHEVGAHTESHIPINHKKIYDECHNSLNFIKQIQDPPYSFASPFLGYPVDHIKSIFDTIRVGYKHQHVYYNDLKTVNLKELISFGPNNDRKTIETSKDILSKCPDECWIILSMHSIDNEGFEPVSSEDFIKLKEYTLFEKYEIKTIKEMTNKIRGI